MANGHLYTNVDDHAFFDRYGFYRRQVWYIATFKMIKGYYRYNIQGFNGMRGGEPISWTVPNLRGDFAFLMREVQP